MKILLVDDEGPVLRGVSRMLESEMTDWEIETSTSGAEALGLLEEEEFNVIVSDMRMPGMDGAQLLEQVEHRFPNVLRVVLSGQADRETVLRAIKPMHQYLSKPCDPQVLIDIIRRAEVFQETISSAEVLDAIGRANCLPSLPQIVTELNRELGKETWTAKSVAKVVSHDPILCARILQLANSAIFGLPYPVVDVERGVSVIGTDMIRSLAVSLAVFSEGESDQVLCAEKLFEHGFSVARISRQLAAMENLDSEQTNSVFSGGLLHDLGKMVLLNAFPERYEKIVKSPEYGHQPFWRLEMQEFGASHQGVGAYLLELWGLPTEIIETVASHHSFEISARGTKPCQVVFAANWIANGADENELIELLEQAEGSASAAAFKTQIETWNQQLLEKED